MANKRAHPSAERRVRLGAAVYFARRAGIGWKALEGRFGRERTQLWRYAAAYERLMQQETGLMQQPACCAAPEPCLIFPALDANPGPDSMSGLFGGNAPVAPTPVATPTLSDPAVTAAARQEQVQAARARGRAGTVLTGGMGVAGSAPVQQKVLLGG